MYGKMLDYVKNFLESHESEATKIDSFSFRKRSEHTKRVFAWANRLTDALASLAVDKDAVLTAAIFHDVGYALSDKGKDHAEKSAEIFSEYAAKNGCACGNLEFIDYLIRNHSNKALMFKDGTLLELIVLIEADLLDETGAMAIVWDCMAQGAQNEQSFSKTYSHIVNYSGKQHDFNPMFTDKAKEFWREKQALVNEFIQQLANDLGEK